MRYYSIGETSRLLRISSELLRYYERLGLITPKRDENGYRKYKAQDIDKLIGIRRYKNMYFPLEQVGRLMYQAEYPEVGSMLEQSLDRVKDEIAWNQALLATMEDINAEWAALEQSAGVCELTISPEIVRIRSRENGVYDETVDLEQLAQWLERMPVVFISPMFSKEDILSGAQSVFFGYGVQLAHFRALKMKHMRREEYYPPRRCVTSVIFSAGEEHIHAGCLEHVARYCRNNGLNIAGDCWGVTLGNCVREGKEHRFHRIYVPVDEK